MFWVLVSLLLFLAPTTPSANVEVEYNWELFLRGTSNYYIHLKSLKVCSHLSQLTVRILLLKQSTTCTIS